MSAATLDLDNLTLAIYQALDETEAELKELGVEMRDYAQGTPETDIPVEPLPTESAPAAPVVPQPVPQTPQPVQQPQPPGHTAQAGEVPGQGNAAPCARQAGTPPAQREPPSIPAIAGSDRPHGR